MRINENPDMSALSDDLVAQIESAWGPLMRHLGYELTTQPGADSSSGALGLSLNSVLR